MPKSNLKTTWTDDDGNTLTRLAREAVESVDRIFRTRSAREACLLAKVERGHLLIPLACVAGVHGFAHLSISEAGGKWSGRHAGLYFPIVRFEALGTSSVPGQMDLEALRRSSVVVLEHQGKWAGLVVNEVLDRLEATPRPFDGWVSGLPGLEGTAILEDGAIAYVVSAADVIRISGGKQ